MTAQSARHLTVGLDTGGTYTDAVVLDAAERVESAPKTAASMRTVGLTPTLLQRLREWKLQCPRATWDSCSRRPPAATRTTRTSWCAGFTPLSSGQSCRRFDSVTPHITQILTMVRCQG